MLFSSLLSASLVSLALAQAEFSSSAILFWWDIFQDDPATNKPTCVNYIEAIAAQGGSKVMIVPTLFWQNYNESAGWADQSYVRHICYRTGQNHNCPAVTAQEINWFENQIAKCFQQAVDRGLNIAVAPHLDDGRQTGLWRNGLMFKPQEVNEGGFSYEQAILQPIVNALKRVIKPETKVWLSLVGETSATIFYHPLEWSEQVNRIKSQISNSNFKVGVSTNFNKLCHCMYVGGSPNPGQYLEDLKRDFWKVEGQFNKPAILSFYQTIDFFGISSYPSIRADFEVQELERAAEQFDAEISLYGVDIRALIASGKEFHFSEYGMGGGADQYGSRPAHTAQEAAENPFFTVFYQDNWPQEKKDAMNPWNIPAVAQYREYWVSQTLKYLQGNAPNTKYKISGLFNWNLGTYDFQATSGPSGWMFKSEKLMGMVTEHNKRIQGH